MESETANDTIDRRKTDQFKMSSKDKTYPFVMDYLPEEYIQKAQKELNETQEKRIHFIGELMKMTKGDKLLSGIDFHPDFLLQFLRVSKFNIDAAFGRLHKYVHFRKKHPKFFTGVEEEKLSSCASFRYISPIPFRSTEGCGISIMTVGEWDVKDMNYEEFQSLTYMVLQQALRDPMTQINGIKLIMDFENTTYKHMKYVTPAHMYQVAQLYLECSPSRFKRFHCVNCTLVMKIAWTILEPFMPEKLRKRVIFHEHPEELLNHFPKHMLPKKYGGELEDCYMYSWIKEHNRQMNICSISGQPNFY